MALKKGEVYQSPDASCGCGCGCEVTVTTVTKGARADAGGDQTQQKKG